MTPKERAAMQQALDAIGDCLPNKALVHAAYALREALDHSGEANEMVEFFSKEMKNKISVARAEQAEQKPIGYVIEDNDYEGSKIRAEPINGCCLPVYLAPVRTKDLTDDEIREALYGKDTPPGLMNGIRAVIAADREKNKCQH